LHFIIYLLINDLDRFPKFAMVFIFCMVISQLICMGSIPYTTP